MSRYASRYVCVFVEITVRTRTDNRMRVPNSAIFFVDRFEREATRTRDTVCYNVFNHQKHQSLTNLAPSPKKNNTMLSP